MKSFPILGIRIDAVQPKDTIDRLRFFCTEKKYHSITTVNAEIIMHTYRNPAFAEVVNHSDLNIIDGSGPEYIAKFLLHKKIKRIPGVDLIDDIMHVAHKQHKKILFLGGRERKNNLLASEIVADQYRKKYQDIQIMVEQGGEMSIHDSTFIMEQSRKERIINFAPDIILLASHNPIQEQIVHMLGTEFPSAQIGIGIGGAFNMKAGILKRAPNIFRKLGLEWLWRLILQPRRIKRIFTAVVVFPLTVLYRMVIPRLRPNIVMCVINTHNKILLAERKTETNHWQFPQGGIEADEDIAAALYKELAEEVHIQKSDIEKIHILPQTHTYTWSKEYLEKYYRGPYQGQKQSIALIYYTGSDDIQVDDREFSSYQWVAPENVLETIHPVRRDVAKIALDNLSYILASKP